jgi:hypothetical protein
MAQNIYTGLCKCIWKIFTLALCRCIFGVNDLHLTVDLHSVYTAIDTHIHNTGLHMAFSASFWSPYKAQRTGLLGFTSPNHCSKFTYPLSKFWQHCVMEYAWYRPLCLFHCLFGNYGSREFHTGHDGLYLSDSIMCNSDSKGWLSQHRT